MGTPLSPFSSSWLPLGWGGTFRGCCRDRGGLSRPTRSPCFSYTLSLSTLAYVTYQDLRAISDFQEQTVIAVKAPPETQLEVPDFSKVHGGAGAVPLLAAGWGPGCSCCCGCCCLCAIPDGFIWGIPRVQPSMVLGGFGVSPWGCLTLSWSFRVCNGSLPGPRIGWGKRAGIWVPPPKPCSAPPPRTTSSST